MENTIWVTVPANTFCWLDDTRVVIVSHGRFRTNGHCELLDTVSVPSETWKSATFCEILFRKLARTRELTLATI